MAGYTDFNHLLRWIGGNRACCADLLRRDRSVIACGNSRIRLDDGPVRRHHGVSSDEGPEAPSAAGGPKKGGKSFQVLGVSLGRGLVPTQRVAH